MRHDIGRHSKFDDQHYWQFARSSGLPRGYFDKPKIITTERVMILVALIIFVWSVVH